MSIGGPYKVILEGQYIGDVDEISQAHGLASKMAVAMKIKSYPSPKFTVIDKHGYQVSGGNIVGIL